ncbi:hypothetical protein R1sor_004108 [Riccia sorocarpa]|uniref:Uncharacterized protein n=1 Tax=Riccia sorocarpa TaxID=122646 RepID=A0ABD3H5P5_9MARC
MLMAREEEGRGVESKNCCSSLAPLNLRSSLWCTKGGEDHSPVSPLYSSLSSLGGAHDGQTSSDDGASTGGHTGVDSKCWGLPSNCYTDSIGQVYDDEKNSSLVDLKRSAAINADGSNSFQNFYTRQRGMPSFLNIPDTGLDLSH